jgi:Uma2 family endonuclease
MWAPEYAAAMHEPREQGAEVRYRARAREEWALAEGTVPEARAHDLTVELVRALLAHWARTARPRAQVGSNLAVGWDEARPQIGVDPDVYLVDPAPPEGDDVTGLRLSEPGHEAPLVAVEVVSASHPTKDYVAAPEKYAECGAQELWVFDPLLAGPRAHGGPHRLQLWVREGGSLVQVYRGDGPVRSPAVGGWLVAVEEGSRLRLADDREGTHWWPTGEEAERADKEAALAQKDAAVALAASERREKDAALARIVELEARLRERG